MTTNSLKAYKSNLRLLYKEIYPKLKKEEIELYEKYLKMFNSKKVQRVILFKTTPQGRRAIVNPIGYKQSLRICDKIEMVLRRFADRHNLLIPDKKEILAAAMSSD